jgi:hypothetical protein
LHLNSLKPTDLKKELNMDISTAIVVAIVLLVGLWVPYYIWYIRRGKARGHTWFTWWKPRGHSDIGPDVGGVRQTRPGGKDEARNAHY